LIGSIVEVAGMQVHVFRLLGEGGYAFLYISKGDGDGEGVCIKTIPRI
jgi:hypothetical protein